MPSSETPKSKMSTTFSSEQGAVYIADTPEQIRKKFKTAVTDSEREILGELAAGQGLGKAVEPPPRNSSEEE